MTDKITAVEAPLSVEQAQQVRILLASRRPLAEVETELDRILLLGTPQAPALAKKTTCGPCECSGFRTCTQWIYVDGRWVPQVVFLESCGLVVTAFACFFSLFRG